MHGHPKANKKKNTWTILRRLLGFFFLPWLCFGDFNEILNFNKKMKGLDKSANIIADFKNVVQERKLIDLGIRGPEVYLYAKGIGNKLKVGKRESNTYKLILRRGIKVTLSN